MIQLPLRSYERILGTCHISENNLLTCTTHQSKPTALGTCAFFNRVMFNFQVRLRATVEDVTQLLETKIDFISSFDHYLELNCTSEQLAFERGRCFAFSEMLNLLNDKESMEGLEYPYSDFEEITDA